MIQLVLMLHHQPLVPVPPGPLTATGGTKNYLWSLAHYSYIYINRVPLVLLAVMMMLNILLSLAVAVVVDMVVVYLVLAVVLEDIVLMFLGRIQEVVRFPQNPATTPVIPGTYPVVIGGGGSGASQPNLGGAGGGNSELNLDSSTVSTGGGGGSRTSGRELVTQKMVDLVAVEYGHFAGKLVVQVYTFWTRICWWHHSNGSWVTQL